MGSVSPVKLVYLVCLVHLVHLVQPNTRDRPDRLDRPNQTNQIILLLEVPAAFDGFQQRHVVGILDIHPDRDAVGNARDSGSQRFELVR